MSTQRQLTWRCFGKVNLSLEVLGRRGDGYHEIETLFQTIDLYDELQLFVGGEGIDLKVRGLEVPCDDGNLVVRAARNFIERWAPGTGVDLHLDKRIPVAAGLGGGSSNAAGTLLALQHLLGHPAPGRELLALGSDLGADVPYFLTGGGTAVGRGRGDDIVALAELARTKLWLAVPPIAVSTAAVFGRYRRNLGPRALGPRRRGSKIGSRRPDSEVSPLVSAGQIDDAAQVTVDELRAVNDLQDLVLETYEPVRTVYNRLIDTGADWVQLSGSGGALVCRFSSVEPGEELTDSLPVGTWFGAVWTMSRTAIAARQLVLKGGAEHGDHRSQGLSRQ